MHIRMLTCAAGPDFSAQPGDFKLVEAEFGRQLIADGHAELAEDAEAREERLEAAAPAARRQRATAKRRATR